MALMSKDLSGNGVIPVFAGIAMLLITGAALLSPSFIITYPRVGTISKEYFSSCY